MTEVTITDPRRLFCDHVRDWKRTGKLELFIVVDHQNDISVSAIGLALALATHADPVPDDIALALGLPIGASYGDATGLVLKTFDEPIVLTPEEEAEAEMEILEISAVCEQLNAENPDMPPVPVAYPKTIRRRQ